MDLQIIIMIFMYDETSVSVVVLPTKFFDREKIGFKLNQSLIINVAFADSKNKLQW
jgi:hypothetical protein